MACALLCAGAASAQNWDFPVSSQAPDGTTISGRTRVVLSPADVSITYTVRARDRDLALTSCRARVADVGAVRTARNDDGSFLFVYLKPGRTAACANGNQQMAVVPIGSDEEARSAVTSISQACCAARAVAAARRPTAVPSSAPSPRPTEGFVRPADWVETDGLFSFLRIRNHDARPLFVGNGEILNCRDVAYGCAHFSPRVTIAPGATATVVTVVSNSPRGGSFSFRYNATSGSTRYSGSGPSSKRLGNGGPAMSADELRLAEAAEITRMTGATPPAAAFVAPRLTERGSTRLAGGKRGVAVLRVQVGLKGMAENVSVVSISDRDLIAAAIEVAVSSRYAPALRNGQPALGDYIATFRFGDGTPAPAAHQNRPPSAAPAATSSPAPSAAPTSSSMAATAPIPPK